jgi:hypothetical protein
MTKLICPSSSGSLFTNYSSAAFSNQIGRAALLAVVLGVEVVLATGCSSTATATHPSLISPFPAAQQSPDLEENSLYQPARSPAFNDLFGS